MTFHLCTQILAASSWISEQITLLTSVSYIYLEWSVTVISVPKCHVSSLIYTSLITFHATDIFETINHLTEAHFLISCYNDRYLKPNPYEA